MHGTGGNSYYQMIQMYMATAHSNVEMLGEERFHGRTIITKIMRPNGQQFSGAL